MPVFAINKTLAAIQLLAQSGTQEDAERVAGLIGVQLVAKNAIVEYTTKKGKVIRGVVRTDLSYAEAKAIDEYTFKKDGGWFVREKHLGGTQAQVPPTNEAPPTYTPNDENNVSSPVAENPNSEKLSPVAGITHDSENSPRSPYDKLTPAFAAKPNQVADIVYEAKEAKKILIDTLKKAFPSVLFSVKKSYHGRNGDYTVSWSDGASETLVKRVLLHFVGYQKGELDVSMDFHHYGKDLIAKNEDGETVKYGFRELRTHRKTSSKFLKGVLSQFSEGKDGEYSVAINNEVFKKYGFNSGSDLYKVVDNGEEGQLLAKDYYGNWRGATHDLIDQFSTAKYNSHTTAAKNRGSNVSSSSNPLESDSNTGSRPDTQSSIENSNANESGELGRMARPSIDRPNEGGGVQRDSSTGLSENDGASVGTASDSIVSNGSGQRGVGERDNASDGGGSDSVNEPRSPVVAKRDAAVVRATTRDTSSDDIKLKEQLEAEGVATKWGDADSIDKALPYLLPEQRDDVAKAEKRLIDDNKNGMLFTNGTGTGKTFTGLGIAKRFANAGKKNILIVSMNDKIIRDFIKSALSLNLDIHQLDGVTDNGKDKIVATTYANLAQNLMLGKRDWDLIIVDEAHNLMQGEQGKETEALGKLRALTGHHAGFYEWFSMRHGDKDKMDFVIGHSPSRAVIIDEDAYEKWRDFRESLRKEWEQTWTNQSGKTKVIFLSATPFSYAKTLEWGEGYLFDFEPPEKKFSKKEENLTYNAGSPREQFYMKTFGYKMRTNRLTRPDGRVDVGILERKFAEKLKTEGAMSGRDLSVPFDYDRKFVLVDSEIGKEIDEGFKFLWDTKDKDGKSKYSELLRVLNKRFDYLARLQLLEAIKAQEAIEQIKKHIALGRKVIVFHDYNEGGGSNPFVYVGNATQDEVGAVESQYEDFKRARPDLIALDLDLDAPITTLRRSFPDALLYNGRVAKGQRSKNADLFNSDNNGHNVLIAQSDAGATGISFHDTTGAHQRVIINIGMPSKPAKLRQTEGRIYRVGQASNAIQRYLTTGTDWERSTFSQKIAERAETVDNLAQGESAVVSIKDALVQAYEEAEYFEPSENDGIGGKAYDEENARINKLTPFERAKSDYWVKQKVTAKRQDREGKEWYATPEPVGLFMVNLSGAHSGDDILEPSAGDGAIGRYMPSDASVTFIEPSESLASRARMNNTNANVIIDSFESHGSNNKYDSIVMNPPFGQGGSIAIKHLVKAFEHLRDGGRVVALLPVGKMDELIVKYSQMGYFKDIYTVAEFALPSSTFKNAGTAVNTKIYVFERHDFKADAPQGVISKNLSHYDDIEDLFDAIENINIKPRKPRVDEALAEYGLEIYPDRSKYIITGEGLKRKDITSTLFGSYIEKNKDGDVVEKYNRGVIFVKWLKDSKIQTMEQYNKRLTYENKPVKYENRKGRNFGVWDGVGSQPYWLFTELAIGSALEDFAVERVVFDSLSSGVSLMDTLSLITSLSKKKDDAVAQQLAVAIGVQIKKPSPIEFLKGDAVASIKSGQIKRGEDGKVILQAKEWMREYLAKNRPDGVFHHPQLGDVTISMGGVKNSASKMGADVHINAIPAVPYVLENSVVLDKTLDKDGKQLENYILAAPVLIDGQRFYAVVRLTKDLRDQKSKPIFYVVAAELESDSEKEAASTLKTYSADKNRENIGGKNRLLNVLHNALAVNKEADSENDLKYDLGQLVASTGGNNEDFFIFAKRLGQQSENRFQNDDYLVLGKHFLTMTPTPYSEKMLKPMSVDEFYMPPYPQLKDKALLNARYDYLVNEVSKYVEKRKSSNDKLMLEFDVMSRSDFLALIKIIAIKRFEPKEKPQYDDIGDFTFMPAIALTDTLNAIVALAKNNSQANAEKLAALLGVKLKEVKTRFNDLPKEQQIDFVADFMARTGVYNLYLGTKKDDDLSDADIAILGDINANYSDDTLREFERNAVKKILEKGVSLTANSRNTIPESDLRGLNITPVAKIVKIKKTAKTPDDLFNLVATTAATDDVRLALTGIKVEANGDLITTDGHTMTVIRDSGIKREAGIYPTSKTVNDFKRKLLKQGKTQEDIDEAIAEHEAALKKENFPDYHRVFPQKKWFMPADFITVDLAKFKGIVDSIYRACTKVVSHKFMGIQLESEDTVATVNYVYLLNAIKTLTSMGYQEAVFWFNHEDTYINRSMMLQSHDEKVSSIMMPMRSNHKDTSAFKPINLNNLDDWNWQKDDFNSVDDETETEYYWLCQEELDLIAV